MIHLNVGTNYNILVIFFCHGGNKCIEFPFTFYDIHLSFFSQMEKLIHQMQDEKSGVPIRTVKSFMSKIPSVFTGEENADEFTVSSYKMNIQM